MSENLGRYAATAHPVPAEGSHSVMLTTQEYRMFQRLRSLQDSATVLVFVHEGKLQGWSVLASKLEGS